MTILGIIFVIAAPLLPSLLWLYVFLKEDIHPEPKRLLIRAFNFGALVSIPVLALQFLFDKSLQHVGIIVLIIGLAAIEEIFKFFAARGAIQGNKEFDEPTDAMIYMIAAALGFALVENFFITINIFRDASVFPLLEITKMLGLRFAGATLLHTIASGMVGYYWARNHLRLPGMSLTKGFILATTIHTVFNYLILRFETASLIYPTLFLILTLAILLIDFESLKIYNHRKWRS